MIEICTLLFLYKAFLPAWFNSIFTKATEVNKIISFIFYKQGNRDLEPCPKTIRIVSARGKTKTPQILVFHALWEFKSSHLFLKYQLWILAAWKVGSDDKEQDDYDEEEDDADVCLRTSSHSSIFSPCIYHLLVISHVSGLDPDTRDAVMQRAWSLLRRIQYHEGARLWG